MENPASRRTFEAAGWGLVAAIVVAIVAHGASIVCGFTFDDHRDILTHPVVTGSAPWSAVLDYNYMGDPIGEGAFTLRPLVTSLFALEYRVFGASAAAFHTVALAWFLGCVVMVWRVANRLGLAAGWIAGLFACLAVNVEAVTSLASSAEVVAAVFALACIELSLSGRGVWAGAALLLALLSKESAIAIPVVCGALLFAQGKLSEHRRVVAALIAAAAGYIAARGFILPLAIGEIIPADNPLLDANGLTRMWVPLGLLGRYLGLTAVPLGLSADYSYSVIPASANFADAHGWLGIAALALATTWGTRHAREGQWMIPMLLVCAVASYGLASNTVLLSVTIFAERLWLFPSLILCMVALHRAPHGWVRWGVVVFMLMQTSASVWRTLDWRTDRILLESQLVTEPGCVRAHLSYAKVLNAAGEMDRALWHLAVAMEGRATFPKPYAPPPEPVPIAIGLSQLPSPFRPGVPRLDYLGTLRRAAHALLGPRAAARVDHWARHVPK